jgi:magnesium-transporting ATPase (P-type)
MTVADGVKSVFDVASNILTFFLIISTLFYVIMIGISADKDNMTHDDDGKKIIEPSILHWKRFSSLFFWLSLTFTLITWIGYVATPTKKDCLLIVAGGSTMEFMTTDSVAKQIPHEVMNFLSTELRNMAAEAKVDLGIQNQKEKVLESVKTMTAEELINTMKSDSTVAKIILDK